MLKNIDTVSTSYSIYICFCFFVPQIQRPPKSSSSPFVQFQQETTTFSQLRGRGTREGRKKYVVSDSTVAHPRKKKDSCLENKRRVVVVRISADFFWQ